MGAVGSRDEAQIYLAKQNRYLHVRLSLRNNISGLVEVSTGRQGTRTAEDDGVADLPDGQ